MGRGGQIGKSSEGKSEDVSSILALAPHKLEKAWRIKFAALLSLFCKVWPKHRLHGKRRSRTRSSTAAASLRKTLGVITALRMPAVQVMPERGRMKQSVPATGNFNARWGRHRPVGHLSAFHAEAIRRTSRRGITAFTFRRNRTRQARRILWIRSSSTKVRRRT